MVEKCNYKRYGNFNSQKELIDFYLYSERVFNEIQSNPKNNKSNKHKSSLSKFNSIEQEKIVEWCLNNFKFRRGFLVTIHLPSYFSFGKISSDKIWKNDSNTINRKNPDDYFFQIEQVLLRFFRRLERKVYKSHKQRLEKFSVIEGCYSEGKRNHIHTLIEIPEHLTYEQMEILIQKSHGSFVKSRNFTNYLEQEYGCKNIPFRKDFELGEIHLERLETYGTKERLFTYLTKEVRKNRYTVSFKNSYEKKFKYFERKKSVKHEKMNRKLFKKNIPNLEYFYKKDNSGLNNLGSCKNSSLSKLKRINEITSKLDSLV